MISCSIILIVSILPVASVFKRFFRNRYSIDFNRCLGFNDCETSTCFLLDLHILFCCSKAFPRR